MEDLKVVFASNLITLRNKAGMTQAQLAEKLNYSDKSVSKWERAEALPDVAVTKLIADTFGVTVDYLLSTHDAWDPTPIRQEERRRFNAGMVTAVSLIGIWTLAILFFAIFWIIGQKYWIIFVAAVPISFVTMLVLNTLWHDRKYNFLIVSGILLSIFGLVFYIFRAYNPWQLALVLIPAELVIYFSFKIRNNINSQKSTITD